MSYTRYFRGQSYDVPGSYSAIDDVGGLIQPPPGAIFPLIMGVSLGGDPTKVYEFYSPQEAIEQLQGGELSTAVQRCFASQQPGNGATASPFKVFALRIGNPTQAKLNLADTTPNAASVQTITLTGTPTAGTFTLSYGGQTTAAIAYNATAGAITTAFNLLPTVTAAGGATITGTAAAGPLVVTFTANGARTAVTLNPSGLTGTTAVATVQTTVGSATNAAAISLTSTGWGSYANGTRITVQNSAAPLGPYRITVQKDGDALVEPFVRTLDPVGRKGIEIQYIGSGTNPTLTINSTALTTTVTGASADNLNVPFATYPTMQNVVDKINSTGKYIALVDDDNANDLAVTMDYITGVVIGYPMTIIYTGAGTAASAAISTDDFGSNFNTTVTGTPADNLFFELNDTAFPTLADVAAAITGVPTVSATVGGGGDLTYTGTTYTVVLKAAYIQMPMVNLPLQTIADIKTAAVPINGTYTTTANLQAVVDYFNQSYNIIMTAVRSPLAGATRLASVGPVYFNGGTNGVAHGTAWANAFVTAQGVDAQVIVPITPDEQIHALALVHCATMTDPTSRRERLAIVGGPLGQTIVEAESRVRFLRSQGPGEFIQNVWPGITDVDFQGTVTTVPPYIVAAQLAGLTCGLGVGKSKTNKFIRATGVEQELTRAEIGSLIRNGVTVIEHKVVGAQRGFRVAKDITCYGGPANYLRHLFASRLTAMIVSKTVREALEPMVGLPNDKNFEVNARNRVMTTLSKCRDQGWLVDGDITPAYRNIIVVRDTDTVEIDFEATIVTEVDFIFTTLHLTVYRKGQ